MRVAICIPTFRRPHLLEKLLDDLSGQIWLPETVIVVDGDPGSGEVLRKLQGAPSFEKWRLMYVVSNHANLPYQRYLGYRAAEGHDLILYLDDDLRVDQKDAVEKVIAPLLDSSTQYVAGTSTIRFPAPTMGSNARGSRKRTSALAHLFGSARHIAPGGLTPAGHRVLPREDGDYVRVEWLRGGVMAFRMSAMSDEVFSDDLFALAEVGCGMGEDTYLGLQLRCKGPLYFAHCAVFEHPNADTPKAYPTQRFRKGLADSYSRRFLNDHYRCIASPSGADRWALLKSWFGAALLSWWRGLRGANRGQLAYAAGYTAGFVRGLTVPPRARRLTPGISWRRDAETALAAICELKASG